MTADVRLARLLADTVADLRRRGIEATVDTLDTAGRPDALVLVETGSAGVEAWYCQPGSSASTKLASALVASAGALTATESASSDPQEIEPLLPCDRILDGRASTAAALVRLPEDASGLGVGVDVGVDVDMEAVLAGAVQRYLVENAGVIRQARRATVLVWPALGAVTSHFGPDHPLGIDIGQSAGNIVAATDGTVRFAGGDPCCSYGLYAVIDSADGITTVYGHFSSLGVKTGDRVRQGQALGVVGCTGHCFGTHLHFEVIVQGRRVDPLSYLP